MLFVAVDIGGTFTDLVAFDQDSGRLYSAKRLTTPRNLVDGILDCVAASGLSLANVAQLIHGSTVAINTLIERKGARTALLVTKGTRDVYAIGRGNRPDAYNLFFTRPRPLVGRASIFELDERILAGGVVRTPLDPAQIHALSDQLRSDGYEAVAVCFLHSYANVSHEEQAGALLRDALPSAYVTTSHEIMREYREVRAHIDDCGQRLHRSEGQRLRWLAGRFVARPRIPRRTVDHAVEWRRDVAADRCAPPRHDDGIGPVGGIIACAEVAGALGYSNSISFDMGGTTAKASLVKSGLPAMAEGYYVGGYESGDPVMIPVVDVIEVGTGGGSIAWMDEVGGLKVGPRSAGLGARPDLLRARR